MRRSGLLAPLAGLVVLGCLAGRASAADGPPVQTPPSRPTAIAAPAPAPALAEPETAALALVRQHLPELLAVLEPLKATNPPEYRKAITEIATEAGSLAALRAKNPARAALALDAWKTRTHVELLAAQLARTPTPERSSELRAAIEARVAVDVRRHQFEADQAEAALVRARENLARAEANRDRTRDALTRIEQNRASKVEARFRALQPKPAPPAGTPKKTRSAKPMPDPMPVTALPAGPMPSPAISAGVQPMPMPMPTPSALAEGEPR